MIRPFIHYGIHFLLPLLVAVLFFKSNWKKAYLIMLSGYLIDLDHLLATPIFQADRCSINFHPLHSYYAIALYIILLLPKTTRLIGLGLVIHIIADITDCILMS
ncbi:hypothetical protein DZC78_05890 [Olleya aquimaris]|uniref:LexA-binding, inner membrane-associated hydrolase n=1 Tax=Olleya sediminilitoris TaxID=2795739 RepID=A0ABS1WPE7_9FLAO|nr:DUF6122 family protein [Olleya sediminilitoris]AXO79938.1 hypothetical protein DZC78_05890 [Olleya aquimaris]MBL7560989.1 hypothetical protein [Olleya sediminilitoris]